MRILMVSHYFGSHRSGIELVAEQLFHRLPKAGCQMVWVAAGVTPPPPASNENRTYPMPAWNGIESAIGLPFPVPKPGAWRRLRQEVMNADVVVLHDCLYLSNLIAFLHARRQRVPIICVQHIGLVPFKNPLLRALMYLGNLVITRPMLAGAQQVVFISEVTQRYFARVAYSRPPVLVFNGVDTDVFYPAPGRRTKRLLRERFALPEEKPVVLFVGRFVEKKGLDVLRYMAAAAPEFTWAFAGWGPMDPKSWNLPGTLVFSGLHGPSLADLYRASDVLVLPSVGEGFPLVIQEALASGLPVVCSEETSGADLAVKDLVRGVARNGGSAERAAAFLVAVREQLAAADPEKAAHFRHEFALSRYSWKVTVERYLEIASGLARTR